MSELLFSLKRHGLKLGVFLLIVLSVVFASYEEKRFGFSGVTAQPYVITSQTATGAATTTEFFGSVFPRIDNQYDLGSLSKRWRNIYGVTLTASSTSFGTSTFSGDLLPSINNTFNIGSSSLSWKDVYVSSTLNLNGTVLSKTGTNTLLVGGSVSTTKQILGAGTAVAPSLTFSGDEDTGVYSFGANSVGIGGSGANNIQVDSNGVTVGPSYAVIAGRDGIGYYFGDAVRGLRFTTVNAGDFEFQNWSFNAFYFTRFDGSSRTAIMTVSASSSKVCVGCTRGDLLDGTSFAKFNVIGQTSSTSALFGAGATSTPSSVDVGIISTGVTSTLQIGNSIRPLCILGGDSDGSGITYVTVNNGLISSSVTPCNL